MPSGPSWGDGDDDDDDDGRGRDDDDDGDGDDDDDGDGVDDGDDDFGPRLQIVFRARRTRPAPVKSAPACAQSSLKPLRTSELEPQEGR